MGTRRANPNATLGAGYLEDCFCSSLTRRAPTLFTPVRTPPQTWEAVQSLAPVLGSITVR
jgi:hypothetical protein